MENSPSVRPPTPQPLLHRAANRLDTSDPSYFKPRKYIILLLAPTSVAGKVQIASSVSEFLSCPLFQGDSLHDSSAKAAAVGANRSDDGGRGRYQRMWLSKMTRTGLLFPEESRPANEGFSGFGGEASSTSTSRRGSGSSVSSTLSFGDAHMVQNTKQYINQPVFAISEEQRQRKSNPALMVLTHPKLEAWHKDAIREATREYGIGIIFVPLFKIDGEHEESGRRAAGEPPILRPLNPSIISQFTSFDALRAAAGGVSCEILLQYGKGKEATLEEEMVLIVNVEGSVEEIIEEVVNGVEDIFAA